ncbi:MAG TPA: transposase [Salinimicrobium sp.]|nr:transposase [Salinimicrobium sp.]
MNKYHGKYRIESNRAQWWDYGWNGAYFITICTKNQDHFFGEIVDGKMNLSRTGIIVDLLWHEIRNHSKFIELDAFVVMPNHIHGILILDKLNDDGNWGADGNGNGDADANGDVETRHALSLPPQTPQTPKSPQTPQSLKPQLPGKTRFQNQGKNTVSSIIGGYKSAVTRNANRLGLENGWQSDFNDHIIRDFSEYSRIKNYIINNPGNWDSDKFNG